MHKKNQPIIVETTKALKRALSQPKPPTKTKKNNVGFYILTIVGIISIALLFYAWMKTAI